MSRIFVVDRKAFLTTFLQPMIKIINPKDDYLSFEWKDDTLRTLVPYQNKVFLLATFRPTKTAVEGDDQVFYLRDPGRLKDAMSMIMDDQIAMKVDGQTIRHKSKNFEIKMMLIDPVVGSRGTASSLNMSRTEQFEPRELFVMSKATLNRLKKVISSFRTDELVVGFENVDGRIWFTTEYSGEEIRMDLETDAPEWFKGFSFSTLIFSIMDASNDVSVKLDKKLKIAMFDVEHEKTSLRYVITQKAV